MSHLADQQFVPLNIAVLTVSDTRTPETDTSGQLLVDRLTAAGHLLAERVLLKDDLYRIRAQVATWIAEDVVQVVLITGGTGFTGRDSTPEAVAERQVSVGRSTYDLPPLFLVMATQNPIEQEGTYPLPEAQLDRFLLHVKIGFPDASVERRILQQARGEAINGEAAPEHRVSQQAIFAARKDILGLYMADAVEEYLVQLVMATRTPAKFDAELAEWIAYGASPRGSISLDRCARAHAWLAGRDFVSPEDIQAMLFDVLRHRLILSFEAEAAGIDQDRVIQRILDVVAVA